MSATFDLAAYLERVGLGAPPRPTLEGVRRLHRAHALAIPFENLDIHLGAGVRLEPEALQDKLVRRRRGGYCFEQNTLFAMALDAIGVRAEPREARVRPGPGIVLPRTHMTLAVTLGGREWLADVGFGGEGLLEPAPMDGEPVEQEGWVYRVGAEGPLRVLQLRRGDAWVDQYAVLPGAVHPVDFDVANWFTSTWPESPFVRTITAQRIVGGTRHVLRNLTYTVMRGAETETRQIARDELVPMLRSVFGIDVPADAAFPVVDARAEPPEQKRAETVAGLRGIR
jgi:N-hydroxyarylamine O-acetyltransferase